MARIRLLQNFRANKLGQSTVEYIMLMAVMTSIILSIMKSDAFQDIFGEDSNFFNRLGEMVEFSYRHGYLGDEADRQSDQRSYGGGAVIHKSYSNDGSSRFFFSTEQYPR